MPKDNPKVIPMPTFEYIRVHESVKNSVWFNEILSVAFCFDKGTTTCDKFLSFNHLS